VSRNPLRRGAVRRSATAIVIVAAALAAASSAWAHATVVSTDPTNDKIVPTEPRTVTMTFSESVEAASGAVRVYDSNAKRVDTGKLDRPAGDEVSVPLKGGLPNGTYTVAWRVVSADSHPVQGSFVFHIGAPGAAPGGIGSTVLGAGSPKTVTVTFDVIRFLGFAALILAIGGVVALLVFLRDANPALRRRLWVGVAGAAGLLALLGPLVILVEGAASAGLGIRDGFTWALSSDVLGTRFGHVIVARTILAAVLCVFALIVRGLPERDRGLEEAAVVPAAALLLMPALGGHASVSGTAAFVLDIAHVLAASIWVGGLAFVVAALLMAGEGRWPLATRCVPRFSAAAVGSVALLLVAGVINGYLQVKSWNALWETTYGQLLVIKVALVLPLLALGAFNNKFSVPNLKAGIASVAERRRFLRLVGVELSIMAVILGVTAVLVSEPPAKASAASATGATNTASIIVDPFHVIVTATPGTAGSNDVKIEAHGPKLAELTITAALPSQNIGAQELDAQQTRAIAGETDYEVNGASFAIPGDYAITVTLRQDEFTEVIGKGTIKIGAP
jgi:copper transport protein